MNEFTLKALVILAGLGLHAGIMAAAIYLAATQSLWWLLLLLLIVPAHLLFEDYTRSVLRRVGW